MIPPAGSSDYHFQPSLSIEENIDSLAQMLTGSPLSYQKETCLKLFESIAEKLPQTSLFKETLETLSKIIENPLEFDPAYIQENLSRIRGIDR